MPGYEGGFNGSSLPDVLDYITRLDRTMSYLMGQLDTENIREIGGWRIEPGLIRSKDYDVGMSTDDTLTNNVRFFAGGTDMNNAPWRVYQDGSGVATGWTVQSKDGSYPRIVLDPDDDLLAAYTDATHYIGIQAYDFLEGIPMVKFVSGSENTKLYHLTGGLGNGFAIESTDDIVIGPGVGGFFGTTYLSGIKNVGSFGSVIETAGNSLQDTLDDLQTQIDGKADWSHTHSVTIPDHNHGNPDNATSGGGTFTVS